MFEVILSYLEDGNDQTKTAVVESFEDARKVLSELEEYASIDYAEVYEAFTSPDGEVSSGNSQVLRCSA